MVFMKTNYPIEKQEIIFLPPNLSQSRRIAVRVGSVSLAKYQPLVKPNGILTKTHRNKVKVFVVVFLEVRLHPEETKLRT